MSQDTITLNIDFVLEDYVQAALAYLYQRNLIKLFVWAINLCVIIMLMFMPVFMIQGIKIEIDHYVVTIFALVLALTHKRLSYWFFKRSLGRVDKYTQIVVSIDPTKIDLQAKAFGHQIYQWTDFGKILRMRKGFILCGNGARFLWLPFESFNSEEEVVQFEQYAAKQRVKIKDV